MTRKVSPEKMLTHVLNLEKMIDGLNEKHVAVGLPKEKVGGQIYGDGENGDSRTIVENALVHEFGTADGRIPERSFLRLPFKTKEDELAKGVVKEFQAVEQDKQTVDVALGRIGVRAVNIVKAAFRSGGFGKWKKLDPETVERKGFSDILEDTRVMRNSVTWVVRDD